MNAFEAFITPNTALSLIVKEASYSSKSNHKYWNKRYKTHSSFDTSFNGTNETQINHIKQKQLFIQLMWIININRHIYSLITKATKKNKEKQEIEKASKHHSSIHESKHYHKKEWLLTNSLQWPFSHLFGPHFLNVFWTFSQLLFIY